MSSLIYNKMPTKLFGGALRFATPTFLFSCIINVLALTGPLFMLQIYDRVLPSGSVETLVVLCVLSFGLYCFLAFLDVIRVLMTNRFAVGFQLRLEPKIFASNFHGTKNDTQIEPIDGLRDLQTVRNFFCSPAFLACFDILWSPIFFCTLFILHPTLGWLGLGSAFVLAMVSLIGQLLAKGAPLQSIENSEAALRWAAETRLSLELVKTQGMLEGVLTKYMSFSVSGLKHLISARDLSGSFAACSKTFRLIVQSGILAVGAFLVLQGELTAGAMIAASILLARALQPIEALLSGAYGYQQARQAATRINFVLKELPQRQNTHILSRPKAHLSVSDVEVVLNGSETTALTGVSFELNSGDALGVIGNSGSGKSTLARALVGFWSTQTGEIRLGGAELSQYDDNNIGQYIGYLPQSVRLMSGTVAQNIARMSASTQPAEIEAAAKRANAHEMILALPNGYDTVISERNLELSGGQSQRIALARALFRNPMLLVLDEPTAALDAEGSVALNDAISAFTEQGGLVVVMTHRPNAIERCNKILVLENGQTRRFGDREEVLENTPYPRKVA